MTKHFSLTRTEWAIVSIVLGVLSIDIIPWSTHKHPLLLILFITPSLVALFWGMYVVWDNARFK